jgi:hypothetical protein
MFDVLIKDICCYGIETFYYLPEVGFGKPQRKQQLSVPSVSSVVNLLCHNPIILPRRN